MSSNTYSFRNFTCRLTGPGGDIDLGYGAAVADEGVSFEQAEDKNTMMTGADGRGMHSLHAANHGTVIVRLLKTSPTNKKLMDLYNYQKSSSALWGQNTIVGRDSVRGDYVSASQAAFKRIGPRTYAKDANIMEWPFDAINIESELGNA